MAQASRPPCAAARRRRARAGTAARSARDRLEPQPVRAERGEPVQIGGRFSSIDGDPARFQRYQDLRDGVLFTDARYARDDPDGRLVVQRTADNVGWRDQRFRRDYERTGKFVVTGLWDQIPQFYSVDTQTPYTALAESAAARRRDAAAIQNGQANLNAYVPIATQFDLRERRDIGT